MTTTATPLAPVFIRLSETPSPADLPAAARKAVAAWVKCQDDLIETEKAYSASTQLWLETHAARQAEAARAKSEGQEPFWPEVTQMESAKARVGILRLLVTERHNDAARILGEHAEAERDRVRQTEAAAAEAALQEAINGVETALIRMGEVAGLRIFWDTIIGPLGHPTRSAAGEIRNAAFAPETAMKMARNDGGFGTFGNTTVVTPTQIVASLRVLRPA